MAELFLTDTNVLLYAVDHRFPGKQRQAKSWLQALWDGNCGRLSWQVLHEFYWNATRKLKVPQPQVRTQCEAYLLWHPVDTSEELVRRAWAWMDEAHIAYWDALIVAAADRAGARYLLSEDLQAGQNFGDVRVVDPFGEDGTALLATLS